MGSETGEKRVTIGTQEYVVVSRMTVADMQAKGLHRVAQKMRDNHEVALLGIRKPKGRKTWAITEFESGNFSRKINLGY